jgi:hypothetical protein
MLETRFQLRSLAVRSAGWAYIDDVLSTDPLLLVKR